MSNRDIALNWQGLPLPVSRQFAVCLTDLLNTHHPTWPQARAVTMNFRDPGYGPESGGFHVTVHRDGVDSTNSSGNG